MPKKISVIIPSYNSASTIERCLESLASQETKRNFEVILVDSSADDTPKIVESRFPWVKLIHLDKKTDQGTARNLGTREACGDLLLFIDSDCIAPKKWVEQMIRGNERGYPAVGGPIINANPEGAISCAGYFMEFNNLLPPEKGMEADHLGSGNVLYERGILEKFGGFPAATGYYLEDFLFNWRLSKNGIKMWFDPEIPMAHIHRETWNSFLAHQVTCGKSDVDLRRRIDMRGSWMVKHKYLSFPILPLLPIVKFFRTCALYLMWAPGVIFKKPLVFPVIGAGVLFWFSGFVSEMYRD